jgi:hypothetical protein
MNNEPLLVGLIIAVLGEGEREIHWGKVVQWRKVQRTKLLLGIADQKFGRRKEKQAKEKNGKEKAGSDKQEMPVARRCRGWGNSPMTLIGSKQHPPLPSFGEPSLFVRKTQSLVLGHCRDPWCWLSNANSYSAFFPTVGAAGDPGCRI